MATYNLVYSVKGGSGKTTFSIWTAYYLNMLSESDDEMGAVLIDMDLLGTSMLAVINGSAGPCQTATINDIVLGVQNVRKKFVDKVKLKNGKYINIIFASMDYTERDKFKSGRGAGYAPVVKHGIFRSGLRELIKHVQKDHIEVQHFIFDMPPNSDGFADAALECVFDKKYSVVKKKDRKNLFIIIGIDWGQTLATINELKKLLLHSDEMMPDRLFLVLNHNLPGKWTEKCDDIRKQKIEEELESFSLKEKERKRIFFLKLNYNDKYAQLGVGEEKGGLGLKNVEVPALNDAMIPKSVISAYAPYKGRFQDTADDKQLKKLLKLIIGEDDE